MSLNISDNTLIIRAKHAAMQARVYMAGATAQVIKDRFEATIIFRNPNRTQVVVSYDACYGTYTVLG